MDIKHITGRYDLNTGLYYSMSLPDLAYTDKNGNVVARFEPTADMKVVEDCIKELLK